MADHVTVAIQPSGTVTLLFSDIEGSTRLLERLGTETYAEVLDQHRQLLREAFARHDGYEVDTEGDAFFVTFARAGDAVAAAEESHHALASAVWPETVEVRVRMGLHTGVPILVDANYVGMDVHRAARIMSAAHGGQVLLSQATRVLVDGREFRDLGDHRLKDFDEPVRLFQVGAADFPRPKTLNNTNLPVPASSFVGRERELAEVTALLRNGGGRLATLTGPGGSGKTRLAVEAAGDVVGDYPDGVFWIGLARVAEKDEDAAPIRPPIQEPAPSTGSYPFHVLDNFEQVIDAAVDLSVLLGEAATSVAGHEPSCCGCRAGRTVPPLAQDEARTFLRPLAASARRRDRGPLPPPRRPAAGGRLAAARAAVLSPAEIRDRLTQRLDLFKAAATPIHASRRSGRRSVVHELLGEPENSSSRGLRCSRAAAPLTPPRRSSTRTSTRCSRSPTEPVRRTGGRFWMPETIGELARERLQASDDADEIGRRHAEWFLRSPSVPSSS